MSRSKAIIFFDGVCILCNQSIKFIFAHDQTEHFLYASLQGQSAHRLIPNLQKSLDSIVVFIEDSELILTKSEAILYIISQLSGPILVLRVFRFMPRPLLDFLYDRLASMRYRIFGVQASCDLAPLNLRSRLLP